MVHDLDEAELSKVSLGTDISIVDFWAPWCKPCHAMMPLLEEISSELEDVKFYKANVNDMAEAALAYGVMSVPTIVVLQGSAKVGSIEGAFSKGKLKSKLEEVLGRL